MKIFFHSEKKTKTYEDLIKEINEQKSIKKYIKEKEPYEIIKNLIVSLIYGEKIELIDSEFTKEEIENLGLSEKKLKEKKILEKIEIKNYEQIIKEIEKNKEIWEITLYTSGTTGRPKKVKHKLKTIARSVKKSEENKKNIWGYAYNPTHFAGLQVFFQTLYNKNSIIYIFDMERKKIEETLKKYGVTHISATPTYYRTMLPYIKNEIPNMQKVTTGGEKYDQELEKQLQKIFPNAKIRNVYASTEAGSLFSSKGEIFKISDRMKDKIKINEEKELLIHKSLLGESETFELTNEWYKTGDLVEKIEEKQFKFISRKTEMINIGGYKVNPYEIEKEIKKIEGIKDVIVKARKNKITGNILVALIQIEEKIDKKEKEKEINQKLKQNLQKWKIPRIIKFVETIELTRTGKKVRN
ncbi:MAG: hypothetical protein PWP28_2749 [Oceanotoga sp.]|jgi:acyl-coenzyme A synthetase/AMP-(fatty) acid ligase|uniref:AMP-binding protein n=1 Tax=Oceanotoga sp. TaxID=2108366 RepID=UPI00265192D1|nr:AMP-binding protein [Oceanotoga sp.]MDN5343867.1 hypothetical protein [Oceanotoga sp.]